MAQASVDDARRLCVQWLPSYHPGGSRVEDLHITSSQAVALIKQLIEDEDSLSNMLNLKRIQVEALMRSDAERELELTDLKKKYKESQVALATANQLVTEMNDLVQTALSGYDAITFAEKDVATGPEEGEIVEEEQANASRFAPNGPKVLRPQAVKSGPSARSACSAFAYAAPVFPWYRTIAKSKFRPKHWYQNTNKAAHRAIWDGSCLAMRNGAGVDHGCWFGM